MSRELGELLDIADQMSLTAREHGGEDLGWITVQAHGFVLQSYFTREGIVFELFLPKMRDDLGETAWHGRMGVTCLRESLSLLDRKASPIDYILLHADKVEAAAD